MHHFRLFIFGCLFCVVYQVQAQRSRVDSLVDVAVEWREKGNAELALRELNAIEAGKNQNERVLYELAYTHLVLSHYTLAITPAKKAMAMSGEYRVDAALVLAQSYVSRGEYKRAQRLFLTLEDDARTDERIPYQFASLYLKMWELDNAEAEVQKAIVLNRSFVDAHLLLSNILIEKGMRVKAMLSLYFYIFLNNDNEDGINAAKQLDKLWKASSGRVLYFLKPTPARDIYFEADQYIKTICTNDSITSFQGADAIRLLSQYTDGLFGFFKTHSGDNFDFYQLIYLDFFIELQSKGYVEPFVYFVSNAQWHAQVLEWIASNEQQFNAFRIWMETR